jgi:hypothetical protein
MTNGGLHVSIAVSPRSCQLDIDSMAVGWVAAISCAHHNVMQCPEKEKVRLMSGYWLRLLDIGICRCCDLGRSRHDDQMHSTYRKPKPGLCCEYILVLAWPVGRMARTMLLLAKEVLCGRGKRKCREPHETRRWTADSEPAARCVGWREHMACILETCLYF